MCELLQGHIFKKRASQNETCLACHSARVGGEYQGNNKGIQGDVHYLKGGMPCVACHSVNQFHNIQRKTPQTESCNNCHGNAKLFLTEADLKPYEKAANKDVVVTAIPPKIGQ